MTFADLKRSGQRFDSSKVGYALEVFGRQLGRRADSLVFETETLGVTADQLVGRRTISPRKSLHNQHVSRGFRKAEKLPTRACSAAIEYIEALVAKHRESA